MPSDNWGFFSLWSLDKVGSMDNQLRLRPNVQMAKVRNSEASSWSQYSGTAEEKLENLEKLPSKSNFQGLAAIESGL